MLDGDQIDRLRDDFPPAAFEELIDMFLAQARLLIDELGDAAAKDDAERVRQAAHKLRGSCASLGATTLTSLCTEVEQQATIGELAGAPGVVAALEKAFAATAEILEAKQLGVRRAGAHC